MNKNTDEKIKPGIEQLKEAGSHNFTKEFNEGKFTIKEIPPFPNAQKIILRCKKCAYEFGSFHINICSYPLPHCIKCIGKKFDDLGIGRMEVVDE